MPGGGGASAGSPAINDWYPGFGAGAAWSGRVERH